MGLVATRNITMSLWVRNVPVTVDAMKVCSLSILGVLSVMTYLNALMCEARSWGRFIVNRFLFNYILQNLKVDDEGTQKKNPGFPTTNQYKQVIFTLF